MRRSDGCAAHVPVPHSTIEHYVPYKKKPEEVMIKVKNECKQLILGLRTSSEIQMVNYNDELVHYQSVWTEI